jgi:hypothetical protein
MPGCRSPRTTRCDPMVRPGHGHAVIVYETERNRPEADTLDRIGKLGGVSVAWLLAATAAGPWAPATRTTPCGSCARCSKSPRLPRCRVFGGLGTGHDTHATRRRSQFSRWDRILWWQSARFLEGDRGRLEEQTRGGRSRDRSRRSSGPPGIRRLSRDSTGSVVEEVREVQAGHADGLLDRDRVASFARTQGIVDLPAARHIRVGRSIAHLAGFQLSRFADSNRARLVVARA